MNYILLGSVTLLQLILACLFLVDCGGPPTASHALISYNGTIEGEKAIYECEDTYGFNDGSSHATITCLNNGTWAQLGTHCRLSECYKLHLHFTMYLKVNNNITVGLQI